jgi:hypothetical protein
MGRATLVNSVLDSQLVYAMCALLIPPEIIERVDRRRRAFLWSGGENTLGAKCLVAWDHVCDVNDRGGLGLKDLSVQNTCLLLKLIHKGLVHFTFPTQNISSYTHHIKSFDACMEH